MKKIISAIMAMILIAVSLPIYASAATKTPLSKSAGIEALRGQFQSGVGPKTNGYALDYEYYSPAGKLDSKKYPLVIFLHGIGHGGSVGSQLADSDMPYWTSAELQSRFSEGGAYILLPRAPEEKVDYWGESLIEPLRALIDDFIETHSNVDTTRISITGSSQGGAMVWNMLSAYPEYFATAFPLASTKMPTTSTLKSCASTSIWVIASKKDPIINYELSTLTVWNNICSTNNQPENCRLSSLGTVYNPDGTKSSDNHHLAKVITYDLHTLNDGLYPEMTTINGKGTTIDLSSPNGLIKWISSTHSDFDGNTQSGSTTVNPFSMVVEVLRNILLKVVNIFQKALGL